MSKVQVFANDSGNGRRTQVKAAITRFLEKDEIRRTFEALLPQKSRMVPLAQVVVSRERIGSTKVTRVEYGGRP